MNYFIIGTRIDNRYSYARKRCIEKYENIEEMKKAFFGSFLERKINGSQIIKVIIDNDKIIAYATKEIYCIYEMLETNKTRKEIFEYINWIERN